MNLTTEQKATLKTKILADPTLAPFYTNGDLDGLAKALNAVAVPAWIVWREIWPTTVARSAICGGAQLAQLDNLTAGKQNALLYSAAEELPLDTATRTAIEDLCGTQNTLKAAITASFKRSSSVVEKFLSTGTGTTAAPAIMTWIGELPYTELIGL